MTVITAFTNGKSWAIGSDSGAFAGDSYYVTPEPKVWRADGALLGGAGSFYANELARKSRLSDPYELRDLLMASEIKGGWSIMVVTQKILFEVHSKGAVIPFKDRFAAFGSEVAIGFFDASLKLGLSPEELVRGALLATARHAINCVAPYQILRMTEDESRDNAKKKKDVVRGTPHMSRMRKGPGGGEPEQAGSVLPSAGAAVPAVRPDLLVPSHASDRIDPTEEGE